MSLRELGIKRRGVKRRDRQMRNRGLNASALVTRSRGPLPRESYFLQVQIPHKFHLADFQVAVRK